jgi:TrkA domain protein
MTASGGIMHTTSTNLLAARDGHRVGVTRHADGRTELVVHDPADSGTRRAGVLLTAAEAGVLADLVGAAGPVAHCARLDRHDGGVAVLQVLIGTGSPWVGRPVTGTGVDGAVVVAVVRDERAIAVPDPALRCRAGDIVVVLGRPDAAFEVIDQLCW